MAAVLWVEELYDGRAGGDDITRHREYDRVFEVKVDDPYLDAYFVGAAPGVPRNGQRHPSDPLAFMVKIDAKQSDQDFTLWYVTCHYDSQLPGGLAGDQAKEAMGVDDAGNTLPAIDPTDRADNPLDRRPQYKVHFEQATEVCREDINGNLILNSAKMPFDPPPMKEVSYPVLTVTKCQADINFSLLVTYQDAVNKTTWRSIPTRCARVVGIDYESQFENNVAFWRVTYRIKVKWQNWKLKLVDQGFYEFIPVSVGHPTAENKRIEDPKTGGYPTEPQLLDGAGRKLGPGFDPIVLEWDIYRLQPFSALGI